MGNYIDISINYRHLEVKTHGIPLSWKFFIHKYCINCFYSAQSLSTADSMLVQACVGFFGPLVCGFIDLWVCLFFGLLVCGFVGLWLCLSLTFGFSGNVSVMTTTNNHLTITNHLIIFWLLATMMTIVLTSKYAEKHCTGR